MLEETASSYEGVLQNATLSQIIATVACQASIAFSLQVVPESLIKCFQKCYKTFGVVWANCKVLAKCITEVAPFLRVQTDC